MQAANVRRQTRCLLALAGLLGVLAMPSLAGAHILHNGGTWTYRYLTRKDINDCSGGTGGSDPFNVLFYQYGEGNRINGHIENETHWGYYPGWVYRGYDYI